MIAYVRPKSRDFSQDYKSCVVELVAAGGKSDDAVALSRVNGTAEQGAFLCCCEPFCQVVLRYFLKNLQSVELCVKSIRQHPLPAKPLLLLQSAPLQAPPAYALRSSAGIALTTKIVPPILSEDGEGLGNRACNVFHFHTSVIQVLKKLKSRDSNRAWFRNFFITLKKGGLDRMLRFMLY